MNRRDFIKNFTMAAVARRLPVRTGASEPAPIANVVVSEEVAAASPLSKQVMAEISYFLKELSISSAYIESDFPTAVKSADSILNNIGKGTSFAEAEKVHMLKWLEDGSAPLDAPRQAIY